MATARFSSTASAIAPWWLGLAFAVSISADAGQDAASGASIAPLSSRAPRPPDLLVPPTLSTSASGDFGRLTGEAQRLLRKASLVTDSPDDTKRLSDELEPRLVPGRKGPPSPVIDRTRKGHPVVGLRPTFDTRLRHPGGLARVRLHDAFFTHDESSPVGGFAEPDGDAAPAEPTAGFEPWPDGEGPTTLATSADTSPDRPGAVTMTMRPAAINQRLTQGATPLLRRAEALASTTPARAESIPIEVVAHAAVPAALTPPMPRDFSGRARATFAVPAGTMDLEAMDQERRCLAEAIYFEARGEPEQGQAAVAQVVLNRASSGLYPPTICGVVYQNRHHYNACQFSFACDGRSLRVSDPASWRMAVRIAAEVTNGKTYLADVGGSTHYHADYVRPRWARRLEKMDVIGHHIFYKLRPDQE
jgi:hypothetical protein